MSRLAAASELKAWLEQGGPQEKKKKKKKKQTKPSGPPLVLTSEKVVLCGSEENLTFKATSDIAAGDICFFLKAGLFVTPVY